MKTFKMTTSANWKDRDGTKGTQVEVLLCSVTKEDNHWIEYKVDEVISVENAPSFYSPTLGGGIKKGLPMRNIEVIS